MRCPRPGALGGLGHRLKGNGASYGFPEITELGAQIERLGKAGQLEAIGPYVEQLRELHRSLSGTRANRADGR